MNNKSLPGQGHANALSPVCVLWCLERWPEVENDFWQVEQTCLFLIEEVRLIDKDCWLCSSVEPTDERLPEREFVKEFEIL